MTQKPTSEQPSMPLWFLGLLCLLPLLGFWATGLFDLDEGFYAAVTGEMIRRGEWITPYYNGQPWFEKPILLYWLSKPLIMFFGEQVGPRLPSVLASLALYVLTFFFTKRLMGRPTAQLASLILATSPLMVGLGRMMMTDGLLVLCLSAALFLFYRSLEEGPKLRWLSGLFLGLAVLAKGPVGFLLFFAILIIFFILQKQARPLYRGGWLGFAIAFLFTISSWYFPCYIVNGDLFVQKFLVEQNLRRFTGGDLAHQVPGILNWIYFVPILFLGMIPWSFYFPRSLKKIKSSFESKEHQAHSFLWVWGLTIFLFFTVGQAKLPHYILPSLPPFAILLAHSIAQKPQKPSRVPFWLTPACISLSICLIANVLIIKYYKQTHEEIHSLTRWVRAQGGEVAIYQMGRQSTDLGTGKLELQETSHPSILFYLNKTALDAGNFQELLSAPKPLWVLTRKGRIQQNDLLLTESKGLSLTQVPTPTVQNRYQVYKLE